MAEGGRVIGQVPGDNPFSPGEMLMLAGRRWRIIEVDGKRRELSVRPAKGGKPPLFPGDPKPPAEGVVREMRRVWEDLAIPAYLDATAKQHLVEARTTYDRLGLRGASVARHDGQLLLFPWVGDRRQQALILALTQAGETSVGSRLDSQMHVLEALDKAMTLNSGGTHMAAAQSKLAGQAPSAQPAGGATSPQAASPALIPHPFKPGHFLMPVGAPGHG